MKDFFVNLYDKFIHLSWVEWTIDYCKREPLWAGIIGGLALFILIILCIIIGKKSSAKKKAKKAAKLAAQSVATTVEPVKATAKAEPVKAEEKQAEPKTTPSPAPVAAKVEVKAEEPVKATPAKAPEVKKEEPVKTAPVKAPEVKKEEPVKTAPVKAPEVKKEEPKKVEKELAASAAPAPKAVEKTVVTPVEEKAEAPVAPVAPAENESETDRIARYKGKWVIYRVVADGMDGEEMYYFELRASNGEKLLSSEEYTTYQGALKGIQTHKTNILKGNLKITVSKKGDYIFKLLSGKNLLLCMGENYPTKARCESAMDSTIRFGATAIIDENVQDIVVKVPKEDDSPVTPLPENCNGKWIISSGLNAEGSKIYYFELFANNGEKLLSSEEYTTYTGAVNGIQTHKKNIEQNNFRISLTKRGDYIYKLLNGNGQLLCLGEHYKTKRLCQSAVDSVQRFALNSPVLTDKK